MAADSNPWQSLGYALYTDDVIAPMFKTEVPPYYVQVLENKANPGLYRLVDPYGPAFPLYQDANSYKAGSYIEIDATDPQAVWIEGWQSTGLDVLDDGLVSITSNAWYMEDVKAAGLCGTYADGVITFPVQGVLMGIANDAYYANSNGGFSLDMREMLKSLPQSIAAAAPVACVKGDASRAEVVGKITRFRKIDNSFLTPTDVVNE